MKNEKELISEIREHLDQAVNNIDSKTLAKIRVARIEAMGQKQAKRILLAVPLAGVAVSIFALLFLINLLTGPDNYQNIQSTQITEKGAEISKPGINLKESDLESMIPQVISGENEISPEQLSLIELLSEEQDFDLIENLEFYTWLAENENSAR